MECVKEIESKDSGCLKNCQGVVVTSYAKIETVGNLENILNKRMIDYKQYKGSYDYPIGVQGK